MKIYQEPFPHLKCTAAKILPYIELVSAVRYRKIPKMLHSHWVGYQLYMKDKMNQINLDHPLSHFNIIIFISTSFICDLAREKQAIGIYKIAWQC